MAATWQQQDIERCLLQAKYRSSGFEKDDAIAWLYVPSEWRDKPAGPAVPHTTAEVEPGVDEGSAIGVITGCRVTGWDELHGDAVDDGECPIHWLCKSVCRWRSASWIGCGVCSVERNGE